MKGLEFYRMALYVARQRDYKIGWAGVMYKLKYEKWPDKKWKDQTPIEASQEAIDFFAEHTNGFVTQKKPHTIGVDEVGFYISFGEVDKGLYIVLQGYGFAWDASAKLMRAPYERDVHDAMKSLAQKSSFVTTPSARQELEIKEPGDFSEEEMPF